MHLPLVDREAGAVLLTCRRLVASAQELRDDFESVSSNSRLEEALALADQTADRTATRLHGKLYGLRGWNHQQLGDDERARTDTETALAECQATGDLHGIRVDSSSLRVGWGGGLRRRAATPKSRGRACPSAGPSPAIRSGPERDGHTVRPRKP